MLCLVLASLFYFKPLFLNQSLFWRDISQLYHPMFAMVRHCWEQGEWPLWNPYLFSGTPLLAGAEPAVFYPGNLLFWLLDFSWAYPLSLIVHHLLACLGMYRLGRYLNWSASPAALAGLIFGFCGVTLSLHNFYPLLATAAWMPLIFDSSFRLIKQTNKRPFYAAVLALCLGMQILSGHFEIVAMTGLFLILNLIPYFIQNQDLIHDKTPQPKWPALAWGMLALGLALALSMIQLWPSFELLQISSRSNTDFAQTAQTWSLHPLSILAFFIPEFHGNLYSDNHLGIFLAEPLFGRSFFFLSHYLGLSTTILAVLGLLSSRKQKEYLQILIWALSFLLCLALALGSHSFFYGGLIKILPVFSVFRYPVKFLIPAVFFFSLLSGQGLSQMLGGYQAKYHRSIQYLLGLWAGFLLLSFLLLHFKLERLLQALWPTLEKYHGAPMTPEYRPLIKAMFKPLGLQFLLALGWVALLSLCLYVFWRQAQYRKYLAPCLLLFLICELWGTGQHIIWVMDKKTWDTNPEVLSWIHNDLIAQGNPLNGPRLSHNSTKTMILPPDIQAKYQHQPHLMMQLASQDQARNNRSLLLSLPHAQGYLPARTQRIDKVLALLEQPQINAADKSHLEALMGIGYIINGSGPKSPLAQRLQTDPEYRLISTPSSSPWAQIWKRQWTLPLVSFRDQAFVSNDLDQLFSALGHAHEIGFNVQQQILIEDDAAHQQALKWVPKSPGTTPNQVQPNILERKHNKIRIKVNSDRSGYLLVGQQYYPGWKAFDNGKEIPLLHANYFQQAVRIGPGVHEVALIFAPRSFLWGRWISLLALCILILMLGWQKFKPKSELAYGESIHKIV